MVLILLRHAERFSGADPDITDRGKAQALHFCRWLQDRVEQGQKVSLYASNKKRTQQTLAPIATALNLDINVEEDLDELKADENNSTFYARTEQALNRCLEKDCDFLIACSHIDWLENAVLSLPSDLSAPEQMPLLSPCELHEFHSQNGIWEHIRRQSF